LRKSKMSAKKNYEFGRVLRWKLKHTT
jgi:hypothetical protein